ncbi:transglutaminase-like domain-containing protein [Butyrivibrio sp. VCB2006]|uniref:transglutaminase-like domain-containing protein n=1 Tax=Butyrivibrio sp. VCB2006 TaxID=1280679 RepID=UPI0004A4F3BF|nr:transglutaminase-like domain-containing protein [Butyrivibrio sp. VCB2006]
MHRKIESISFQKRISLLTIAGVIALSLCACGKQSSDTPVAATKSAPSSTQPEEATQESTVPKEKGSRDNTSVCLVPETPGTTVYENEYAVLDASNITEGYLVIKYIGSSGKVKLQITGPTGTTYTYNLTVGTPTFEVFPLQCGNGEYLVNVFEQLEGTQYTTVFSQMLDVQLTNEFGPFLYPNQYCTFSKDSNAVKKASDLAYPCNSDLDVVSEIYNFMIKNIKYDYEEAETVQSGYLPDVDEVLSTKTGICLDYSALMCCMLRSQRIPTRMEIGYAGTAYHAWISTYIEDIGWVNGMIQFDGKEWSLMDPTFASNTEEKSLQEFIGDGENYSVKYIY